MKIDPEFKSLIAPLVPDELMRLESSIQSQGCREPLVLWQDVLVDGHNRHEICERLGVKYKTVTIELASRDHVLLWIEENQLGRRNLTDDQRAMVAWGIMKRRSKLLMSERAQKGGRGHKKLAGDVRQQVSEHPEHSRRLLSRRAKLSEYKLRLAAEIAGKRKDAIPAVRAGEKTLKEVLSEIRRAERMDRLADLAAPPELGRLEQRFPIIYIDPPWRYDYTETEARAIENQYPTMSLEEICDMEIDDVTADDCVLFLWATNPKLGEAFEVLKAWEFEYRTNMVWVKDKIGMGYYARQQHELLLIAKRGDVPVPEPGNRPSSVLTAPRLEHSAKPQEMYDLIDRMYPTLPKLEIFARQAARPGWTVWGNQTGAANGS